ncbi:MAG: SUMF1/EgtB/PvdO family nonheme iron enzyme [Polyangiaceae bacterium]
MSLSARSPGLLLALPFLAGCQSAAGEPAPPAPDTAAVATGAPSAKAGGSPGSGAGGPCAGKSAGEHACDGAKLVSCGEGGASTVVKTCFDIERCDADQKACVPACSAGEVYIPPTGPKGFRMGKGYLKSGTGAHYGKGHFADSDAPHNVVLTKPFCMDENEVTVKMLKPCVEKGECKRPRVERRFVTYPDKEDYPVNSFSWPEAKAFCERTGKTLPTEAQWEWAADGGEGHTYPWGDEPASCERADYTPGILPTPSGDAGCHAGGPSKVGSHPAGDRVWPTGHLHDMAGNVWEWCLDNYKPYSGKDEVDPLHMESETAVHVVRGGGWNRSADGIRVSFRGGARYDYWVPGLGFRCVRNAKEP